MTLLRKGRMQGNKSRRTADIFGPSRRSILRASVAAALALPPLVSCANSGTSNVRTNTTSLPAGTVVQLDSVEVGRVREVRVDGRPAFVARAGDQEVRAFFAVCPHQGCTVNVAGDILVCPCHGSQFELLTGDLLRGPAETALPSISVRIDGGAVVRD